MAGTSNESGVVDDGNFWRFEWLLLLPYLRKLRNNVGIKTHYDNTPFWIPAGTNKDDLECPIHLKVRLVDGTLDVAYVCCGFRIRPYA